MVRSTDCKKYMTYTCGLLERAACRGRAASAEIFSAVAQRTAGERMEGRERSGKGESVSWPLIDGEEGGKIQIDPFMRVQT